jgi:excinuclease ABC subunit A
VPLDALKTNIETSGVVVKKQSLETPSAIKVIGARHHNLKNLSVEIPPNQLTVLTGVSGSGKSTLAFDIIFQEGQRRYIDCLSPYARQYMTHLKRADVDLVENIPPTIAVSQKTAPPMGVSTIATTTEIYQFLRLLYSKVGVQHCPKHDLPIQGLSQDQICEEILQYSEGKRTFIFAPAVSGRKGYYNDLFQRSLAAEIEEARIDGSVVRLTEDLRLERHKLHWISLLTASFSPQKKNPQMLQAAIQQALLLGEGTVEVALDTKGAEARVFSSDRVCPKCKRGFRELDPQDFSFRSQRGLCVKCGGRGVTGEDDDQVICATCDGARIGEVGRSVLLGGKRIFELSKMTAPELLKFVNSFKFLDRLKPVVEPVIRELIHRLEVIDSVGLGYLSLDRDASTISGGEAQRLRLARTLGSPLTGICYVLDEPTIGLHPKDHERLMEILFQLRDRGNTVLVVEHDEETICLADHVIDIGPDGGAGGGRIVAQGSPIELLKATNSKTGQALKARLSQNYDVVKSPARKKNEFLKLTGASANNLKDVNAEFLLQGLTVVCGVSGAGKSSLVHSSLVPAILEEFGEVNSKKKTFEKISGHDSIQRYLEIDQSPVGKTPASCPASYLGVFDQIRKLYAMTPDAQVKGYNQSYFSYNSGKGRCSNCEGKGYLKIPMSFLPDAMSECEVCRGLRYNDGAQEILYQGFSIGEVLQKTMTEARDIFANHALVRRTLNYICDLGIGYLTLGQPTHTLSGGEIQRLKLARELGAREAVDTLYILDEPTVGLHMTDVEKLMNVIRKLIEKGNSVVMIEHNLDVISAADYLIELGPGPGDAGGRIIFAGTPAELRKKKTETPTRDALLSKRSQQFIKMLAETKLQAEEGQSFTH